MDYQKAYKVAEEINTFFGLGFDGRKLAQLSQILINNAAQQSVHPTDGGLRDLQASSKPPYSTNPKPDLGKPISW